MPTLTHPGSGPPGLGRFTSPRSTVLPFGSVVTPVGVDGHTEAAAQGTAVASALPTGLVDLDLVLIEVSHGSGGPPGTTITTPTGWNLLSNVDDGSSKLPVFWRFFVAGDAAPSFTLGTSRSWATRSTAFRNVDPAHPFGPGDSDYRQVAQASGGTYTSATITPGEDGALLVTCWGGKVASGIFQTISTAAGWLPTGAINQSSIAAVVNQWCHFQYRPLVVMAPISETVTITSSAVGHGHIIALRPAGLPVPAARFGSVGTALHPGPGPSRSARFWQLSRSTEIPTVGGESHAGAATGEQRVTGTSSGAKQATGAAQGASRVSGSTTGAKGVAGATLGAARTAGLATVRKQALGGATDGQRTAGIIGDRKQAVGATAGEQRTAGFATTTPPPPSAGTVGQQRTAGMTTARKGAIGSASGQTRHVGGTSGIHRGLGTTSGQQRITGTVAATSSNLVANVFSQLYDQHGGAVTYDADTVPGQTATGPAEGGAIEYHSPQIPGGIT